MPTRSGKRPCSICRQWFTPDPRTRGRQHTCNSEECRQERNKRACKRWRDAHADDIRADRLRQRLQADPAPSPEVAAAQPLARLRLETLRHEMGSKGLVLLEELLRVLLLTVRHEMHAKNGSGPMSSKKVLPSPPRHETDRSRAPP